MAAPLAKGSRITGDQRQALSAELAGRYTAGESIRAIAESTGRSFGFVHGLVKEAGVTLRGRGGATRGSAVEAARAAVATPASGGGGSRTDDRAKNGKGKPKPTKSKKPTESKKDDGKKSKKGKR